MKALLIVDAQNEFSPPGKRPVGNHAAALAAITARVGEARRKGRPIAWIRHHNRPDESPAFVPGSWGAELSPGLGPREGFGPEVLLEKDVYGAFTGTGLGRWLRERRVDCVLVVGFYAHMCMSTSVREALVRGFRVEVDPQATGARDLDHPLLGRLSAAEVCRTALLQVLDMGATVAAPPETGPSVRPAVVGSSELAR